MEQFSADEDLRRSTVYLSLRLTFWLTSFLINMLIFVPTLLHQNFRRDSFKNVLAQLALGDIFLAIGSCARHLVNYGDGEGLTLLHCTLLEVFQLTGFVFIQLAILFISIDRFIAVKMPLFYHKLGNKRVIIYRWVIVALLTTVIAAPLFVEVDPIQTVYACKTSASWPMWYIRFIYGLAVAVVTTIIVLSLATVFTAQRLTQSEYNSRIYYTFIYITAVYVFLWTVPKISFLLITKVSHPTPLVSTLQWHVNGIADNTMGIANFVIYGWRHREVREAVVEMFQYKKTVRVVEVGHVVHYSTSYMV
ncbi:hypothetical protein QR680_007671 [Steinernema hermaphroditum]|uniref:G-protein coupled receptors family 1 profile domain-containing protein n=1 Tax=Steinernema hermaphroditum TaxID=289476 RepID=A0AA39M6C2_9BILA|nr:hypothetical protein QR680_007671 [Steinernema hermaphroditum]